MIQSREQISFIKFFIPLLFLGLLIGLNIEYLPVSFESYQQHVNIMSYGIITFLIVKSNFSEYLQNTFRSPASVLRLTGKRVLGIIPSVEIKKQYTGIASSSIAQLAYGIQELKQGRVLKRSFIVGLFSLDKSEGKSFIGGQLSSYISRRSKQSCILIPAEVSSDALIDSLSTYDIVFLEYPALNEDNHCPKYNINNLNVVVSRSYRGWNNLHRNLFNQLCKKTKSDPYFVLNFH